MSSKKYNEPRKAIPESIKMQIRLEARHSCSICGITTPLEFHHIDENRENNSLENIILLCCNHHTDFHNGLITKRELIEYKNRLKTNFIRNDELDFYLQKVYWLTDNLLLEKWEIINEMIGNEHSIDTFLKEQFEKVASYIHSTHFPSSIHQPLNNIFNDLANSLDEIIEVFMTNQHIDYKNNRYFLSREWKGKCWYSQEEYDKQNQIDIDFEISLHDAYYNTCVNIWKFQEYVWENLDFNYLERVRVKGTFYKKYSANLNFEQIEWWVSAPTTTSSLD